MRTEQLHTIVDRRLAAMEWTGEDAVLRALHAARRAPTAGARRRLRTGLVLAVILLLLLGTALALGLIYSEGYSRRKAADRALMDAYGLSQEAVGMFLVRQERTPGGTRFTYEPYMHADKVGTYTVLLPGQGHAVTRWSHDGGELPREDEGLDARIWGARQLNAYVRVKNAYYERSHEIDWNGAAGWTLEQRAQVNRELQSMQRAYGEHVPDEHIVPGPEDITREDAVARARDALTATFGVDEARLDALRLQLTFTRSAEDGARRYRVLYNNYDPQHGGMGAQFEAFLVDILSPSGEAVCPRWQVNDLAQRTLPEGDLSGYRIAVTQYMESGAFERLPAAEKGRLASRIAKAGLGDLLGQVQYAIPGDGALNEAGALALAADALGSRFGLTARMRTLFTVSAALVVERGQVLWDVTYKADDVPYWRVHAVPPVGDYTVRLHAATGEVLEAAWSLAGRETRAFTRDTWGQAEAYDAAILPWYMDLLEERGKIIRRYPEEGDVYFMSLEDNAAYAALFRRNGFSARRFPDALPGPGDLQLAEARALAMDALRSELHLDERVIRELDPVLPGFLMTGANFPGGTGDPVWVFTCHHKGGIYVVVLKADTGALLVVQYGPAAAGNG